MGYEEYHAAWTEEYNENVENSECRIIHVRSYNFGHDVITWKELLSFAEKEADDNTFLQLHDNNVIEIVRNQSLNEFILEKCEQMDIKKRHQDDANSSWERQKRKFAKSRK